MKAIGYIRVSTEDQAREGISLDNQESKVRAYADLHGLELVDVIRDEGVSGKSLERPGFERLQDILNVGKAQAVIVYKLDRVSRKTIDILNTLETWEKREIVFHSITDNIDTKTAAGKFLLTILSALAQMERDLIAERTIDALSYKKKNGEWCGSLQHRLIFSSCRTIQRLTTVIGTACERQVTAQVCRIVWGCARSSVIPAHLRALCTKLWALERP